MPKGGTLCRGLHSSSSGKEGNDGGIQDGKLERETLSGNNVSPTVSHALRKEGTDNHVFMNQGCDTLERSDPVLKGIDNGVVKSITQTTNGPSSSVGNEANTNDLEESWVASINKELTDQPSPDDPCWDYLQQTGVAQNGHDSEPVLTAGATPLKGKRWYIVLMVSGQRGEFLVDTGASHTLVGRAFMVVGPTLRY